MNKLNTGKNYYNAAFNEIGDIGIAVERISYGLIVIKLEILSTN